MSFYDVPKGNADRETGRRIYMAALADRRGFRDDQLGISDLDIWAEIFEAVGVAARPIWTPVATPPDVGGHYVVGGYIDNGTMPRHFQRTFATCILTLDGPEWSHRIPQLSTVPIEYWLATPPHPEYGK